MITDLRFAFRQLRKSPGFTLLATITLALGIGLNTAIFSLINDLFLRGLPFKQPDRVVHMLSNAKDRNVVEIPLSAPRFQHYRDSQTIFDGFAAENVFGFTLTGLGDPVQLIAHAGRTDGFGHRQRVFEQVRGQLKGDQRCPLGLQTQAFGRHVLREQFA